MELYQDDLKGITKKKIKEAIYLAFRDGIKSVAPLGFRGDDILLFGNPSAKRENGRTGRKSVVMIFNHSGNAKMLITDTQGHFLFHGGFDINIGVGFIADEYWPIFKKLRHRIETERKYISKFADLEIPKCQSCIGGYESMLQFQLNS